MVSALAKVEQNEERLVESISQDIYIQIVNLARIYDLQLIVASLDALYYLSEIGEGTCECISMVKHCIGEHTAMQLFLWLFAFVWNCLISVTTW